MSKAGVGSSSKCGFGLNYLNICYSDWHETPVRFRCGPLSEYAVDCQTVAPKPTLIIAIVAILAPVAAMAKAQASQIPRHIKITPFNS
jgi:hypothetical protein